MQTQIFTYFTWEFSEYINIINKNFKEIYKEQKNPLTINKMKKNPATFNNNIKPFGNICFLVIFLHV